MINALKNLIRRFGHDENGVAMVLLALLLPVMIGFSILAVDMARVNNLHNDLQEAADALALAAAGELDGAPFAINRAKRALTNLVANESLFSDAGLQTVSYDAVDANSDVTVYFLKTIPADDTLPFDPTSVTYAATVDADAKFIQVDVKPTAFTTIFPATFIGSVSNQSNISASAIAGFGSAVCDFTPMFICNPYENGPVTIQEAASTLSYRRRQINMRYVGAGAASFPGNFGFLDFPGGNGANELAKRIASASPQQCYSSRGVDTKTGQNSGPVKSAFNVRFGIDEPGAPFSGAEYGPGENVRRGSEPTNGVACPKGQNLVYPDDPIAAGLMGLPVDPCFVDASCTNMDGRMGDGDWDLTNYWQINHGGTVPSALWDGTADNLPTRYEVYRYEIDNNLIGDVSTGGETGTPKSGCGTPINYVDRRLLYVAILNCQALAASGENLAGAEVGLAVESFASFFITEPVKSANTDFNATVFAELVDVTGREGEGTLENFARDEVQLYR